MKYVRFKDYGFVLFPNSDTLWHKHVGRLLGDDAVMSAGFVEMDGGVPVCHGRSESLGVGSLSRDSDDLEIQLRTGNEV